MVILLASAITIIGDAGAAPISFSSPVQQTTLIELYTSEGCNSCPPADRWLSQYKNNEHLWTQIVPVAFHVDYWDYLGWRDRFSSAEFSKRQYQYKQHDYVDVIYTPGIMRNGREWRGWLNAEKLVPRAGEHVGRLEVVINNDDAIANFESAAHRQEALTLNVALLGFQLTSNVAAGENNGKLLSHDFVVLRFRQQNAVPENDRYHWQLDNVLSNRPDKAQALALWVSEINDPTPVQAAGGWLK